MSVGRLVAVFFLAWVSLYLNSMVVTAVACGAILVGSFLWLVVPVATPEPRPTVVAPVSESDAAISVYVDRYLRDVIDVEGLEAGIDRVLRAESDGGQALSGFAWRWERSWIASLPSLPSDASHD